MPSWRFNFMGISDGVFRNVGMSLTLANLALGCEDDPETNGGTKCDDGTNLVAWEYWSCKHVADYLDTQCTLTKCDRYSPFGTACSTCAPKEKLDHEDWTVYFCDDTAPE